MTGKHSCVWWPLVGVILGCAPDTQSAPGSKEDCPTLEAGPNLSGYDQGDAAVKEGDGALDDSDVDHDVRCGDYRCAPEESCVECPGDCGRCPACEIAPSCTGAPAVPTTSIRLEEFDIHEESLVVSNLDEGVPPDQTDCMDPQLRLRLRHIKVYETGTVFGVDLYCVLTASDGFTSELFVTPLHTGISNDHLPLLYDPMVSAFWGQRGLHPTMSNLTVTYQCYRSTDNSTYQDMLDSVEEGALAAGGVAGPYGWAFGLGSIAASLASAALGQSSDKLWLNVQQTIDANALLDLTNGRIWQVRQSGPGETFTLGGIWDWMLEIEAWGCADTRATVQ